jgi:CTP:phosphocholine cytidylyltransferase-like protein
MIHRYFILHQFDYLNERHDIDLIALRNHLYENNYNLTSDLTAILCEIRDHFF